MSPAIIISAIALVLAILSPVITALLQNSHEKSMYNAKFYIEHKAEVIENYIKYAGYAVKNKQAQNEYAKYYGQIFLYAPEELWEQIDELDKLIASNPEKQNRMLPKFTKICQNLSKYTPRSNWNVKK